MVNAQAEDIHGLIHFPSYLTLCWTMRFMHFTFIHIVSIVIVMLIFGINKVGEGDSRVHWSFF